MDILQDKEVKARKNHTCDFCGMKISKGEKYISQINVSSSCGIYNWKSHIKCTNIARELNMYDQCDGDGLTGDMFWEDIRETYNEMYGENELPRDCDCLEEIEKLDTICDYYLGKEKVEK